MLAVQHRSLVATNRNLFVVGPDAVEVHPLEEFAAVRRAGDALVVVEHRSGPPVGIPIDPGDEAGLQALTVLGLLVALGPAISGSNALQRIMARPAIQRRRRAVGMARLRPGPRRARS